MGQYFRRVQQVFLPLKEIQIELRWRDQAGMTMMTFADVQDLAHFLNNNPDLGKAVKYVKKKSGGYEMPVPDSYCELNPTDQKIWLFRAKDVIQTEKGVATFNGKRFDDFGQLEEYIADYCLKMKRNSL
jgi:hypothetical protein